MNQVPEVSTLQKLRVVDLKQQLLQLGLPTSGLKAALVERLHKHYVEKSMEVQQQAMPTMPQQGMMQQIQPGGPSLSFQQHPVTEMAQPMGMMSTGPMMSPQLPPMDQPLPGMTTNQSVQPLSQSLAHQPVTMSQQQQLVSDVPSMLTGLPPQFDQFITSETTMNPPLHHSPVKMPGELPQASLFGQPAVSTPHQQQQQQPGPETFPQPPRLQHLGPPIIEDTMTIAHGQAHTGTVEHTHLHQQQQIALVEPKQNEPVVSSPTVMTGQITEQLIPPQQDPLMSNLPAPTLADLIRPEQPEEVSEVALTNKPAEEVSAQIEQLPAQVDRFPALIEQVPAQVEQTPAQVQQISAQVDQTPSQIEPHVSNLEPSSAPIESEKRPNEPQAGESFPSSLPPDAEEIADILAESGQAPTPIEEQIKEPVPVLDTEPKGLDAAETVGQESSGQFQSELAAAETDGAAPEATAADALVHEPAVSEKPDVEMTATAVAEATELNQQKSAASEPAAVVSDVEKPVGQMATPPTSTGLLGDSPHQQPMKGGFPGFPPSGGPPQFPGGYFAGPFGFPPPPFGPFGPEQMAKMKAGRPHHGPPPHQMAPGSMPPPHAPNQPQQQQPVPSSASQMPSQAPGQGGMFSVPPPGPPQPGPGGMPPFFRPGFLGAPPGHGPQSTEQPMGFPPGMTPGMPPQISQDSAPPSEGSAEPQAPPISKSNEPPVWGEPPGEDMHEEEDKGDRLPSALEKILSYKKERAEQLGLSVDEIEAMDRSNLSDKENTEVEESATDSTSSHDKASSSDPLKLIQAGTVDAEEASDEEESGDEEKVVKKKEKLREKQRRRKKKKKKNKVNKFEKQLQEERIKRLKEVEEKRLAREKANEPEVEIEYITEEPELEKADPAYSYFTRIFEQFKISAPVPAKPEKAESNDPSVVSQFAADVKAGQQAAGLPFKARPIHAMMEEEEERMATEEDTTKMSKKKLKKQNRLSVAELKQMVSRPDVVEWHDVTAHDPHMLIHLKSVRNTVPVPRHWCFKRKYLQGKRGIEKPPFNLPDFIKQTGIMEMRSALQEKEHAKSMKMKMREKVRPKMGKIDIDYQKLHDAFFKYQMKPRLTVHGDLYYEGKEFETQLKEKQPGHLTNDLRVALGMPIDGGAERFPPPWLIAMQRYGPPPSYPDLKIPGLNAPIPDGCSFGYHAGGWGKPPVDEHGRPLYGDVFGVQAAESQVPLYDEDIDKTYWGEMESESEESSEEEEEQEPEKPPDKMDTGLVTPVEGLVTPSGVTSVPAGMETPGEIELRKKRIEDAMEGGDTPAGQLYHVLPEKRSNVGPAMMGSTHVYDMAAAMKKAQPPPPPMAERPPLPPDRPPGGSEGIEVTLQPDELDLDTAAMRAKYEQTLREQQQTIQKEDLSEMVAEHAAKQRKRKQRQQDSSKSSKKYKEFKF